jgi:ribosomal protein S18 acetylase RimI-like enzyme
MNITLRATADSDLELIRKLFYENKAIELNTEMWPQKIRDQILEMQFNAHEAKYSVSTKNKEDSILLYNNEQVGRIIIERTDSVINLSDIMIFPHFQGMGIGSYVIQKFINESVKSGCIFTLTVSKINRAHGLYSKLGFTISEQTDTDFKMIYQNVEL